VYKIIATRLEALFGVLHGLTEFLTGVFTGDWDRAWGGIRKIIDSWWGGVTSLLGIIKETITSNFGDAIEGAKNLVDSGLEGVETIFGSFVDRIDKILGSNIKTSFKNAINAAIQQFNKFIGWVNSKMKFSWDGLKVAGKTIFEGGSVQLAKIPTIPKLAKGAIVDSPTLAMIGEKGKEAVVPLENNTGWMDILAQKVAAAITQTTTKDNNSGDLIIRVGEIDFARIAIKAINNVNRLAGTTLLEV
jgi:phage-related protein